ncbi:hypothetical protein FOL47_010139 [Perkinsus chesapeaki]|uniref:Uncharacterized protein n=1 Tax=Perkinsus chesapeaki TaxID=330153 RepID=A0A7J6MQ86_PERCH|nr:hypothetical protein FOL47_010139 [Perkinsus chesapeaki]
MSSARTDTDRPDGEPLELRAPPEQLEINGDRDGRGSSSSSTTPPRTGEPLQGASEGLLRYPGFKALTSGTARQVVYTDLGDPITSLHIGEWGLAAGTMLGKVWYYSLELDERIPLAGFSDDAVKAIYVRDPYTDARRRDAEVDDFIGGSSNSEEADIENALGSNTDDFAIDELRPTAPIVYATVGDSCAKIFDTADPSEQSIFKFERRSSASVKYVVQRQDKVAIVFPGMTTFIDLVTENQNMTPFRLQGTDDDVTMACPTDMRNLILLLVEHYDTKPPCFKVVDLEHDQQVLDYAQLPSRGRLCHFIRILGPRHLVLVADGCKLCIYNFIDKKTEHVLKEHRSDIVSIDTTFSDEQFVSVDTQGEVRLWNAIDGKLLGRGRLPSACDFSLGFPYYVSYCPRTGIVAQSCDSGVFRASHKLVMSKDSGARMGRWFRERIYWPRTSIGSVAEEGHVHGVGGYARRGSRTGEPEDEEMVRLQYPTSHSNLSSLNLGDAPSWCLEGSPTQGEEILEDAQTDPTTGRSISDRRAAENGEAYCERAMRAALGRSSNLAPASPYMPQRSVSPLPSSPATAVSPSRVIVRRVIRHVSPLNVVRNSSIGAPSEQQPVVYRMMATDVEPERFQYTQSAAAAAADRVRSQSPSGRIVNLREAPPLQSTSISHASVHSRLRSPERTRNCYDEYTAESLGSLARGAEFISAPAKSTVAMERPEGSAMGTGSSVDRTAYAYTNPVIAETSQEEEGENSCPFSTLKNSVLVALPRGKSCCVDHQTQTTGKPPRAQSVTRLIGSRGALPRSNGERDDGDRESVDDAVGALHDDDDEGEPEIVEELPSTRQASPKFLERRVRINISAASSVSNTLGSLSSSEPSALSAVECGGDPIGPNRTSAVTTETQTDDLEAFKSRKEQAPSRSPPARSGPGVPVPAYTPGRNEYKATESVTSGHRTPLYATPWWGERTQELREKEARLELYLAESARRRDALMDSIKKRHASASSHQRNATAARELDFGGRGVRGTTHEELTGHSRMVSAFVGEIPSSGLQCEAGDAYQRSISAPRSMRRPVDTSARAGQGRQNVDPNVGADNQYSNGRGRPESKRSATRSPVEDSGPSGGVYVAEGLPRQSAKRRRSSWHGDRHRTVFGDPSPLSPHGSYARTILRTSRFLEDRRERLGNEEWKALAEKLRQKSENYVVSCPRSSGACGR